MNFNSLTTVCYSNNKIVGLANNNLIFDHALTLLKKLMLQQYDKFCVIICCESNI